MCGERKTSSAVNMDVTSTALLTGAACCLGAVALLVKAKSSTRAQEQKIQRARSKREEGFKQAAERVHQFKGEHPTTEMASILAMPLSELQEKLQQGSVSPEEVFFSYMDKALALQSKLNCCTEVLLESFDQVKTMGSNKEGLLYGVPVSIKDNVGHKNYDNTCGLVMNLEKPEAKDSVLVEVLKKQGAIPFVKTNVPQALLSMDCSNPIFGETAHPSHALKSPGGSSGGEGALIGAGGSLLGVGTDIGGSVRIPAAFCGICGLKPTMGRLSVQGVTAILPGQKSVKSTVGPMAKDVDSLARIMEALLCDHMFFLDPTIPPLPFNMQIYQSSAPLRIGYVIDDDHTQPPPSTARAIREVKALLEKAGHVLVPYRPLHMERVMSELTKGTMADGGATLINQMKGGPVAEIYSRQYFILRLPKWLRKILALVLKVNVLRLCSHQEYTAETVAYWRKLNIDVLLCPSPGPALQRNESSKILRKAASWTMIYNGLNFPAGVVPVSTVTAEDEKELDMYKGFYQDAMDKCFKKAVSGGEGLPVAVQCVALPWQDELCLRFMREVEKLVKESTN
uniref:Fatty-acid amide hydrolase 1 n=1 Tax=Salarias fasciatus TaxID=181472 RepID=A0A672I304_SALFA